VNILTAAAATLKSPIKVVRNYRTNSSHQQAGDRQSSGSSCTSPVPHCAPHDPIPIKKKSSDSGNKKQYSPEKMHMSLKYSPNGSTTAPVYTLYDLRPEDIIVTRKYSPVLRQRDPSVESNEDKRVVKVVRGPESNVRAGNDYDADFDELEREQCKTITNGVRRDGGDVARVESIVSVKSGLTLGNVETVNKNVEAKDMLKTGKILDGGKIGGERKIVHVLSIGKDTPVKQISNINNAKKVPHTNVLVNSQKEQQAPKSQYSKIIDSLKKDVVVTNLVNIKKVAAKDAASTNLVNVTVKKGATKVAAVTNVVNIKKETTKETALPNVVNVKKVAAKDAAVTNVFNVKKGPALTNIVGVKKEVAQKNTISSDSADTILSNSNMFSVAASKSDKVRVNRDNLPCRDAVKQDERNASNTR